MADEQQTEFKWRGTPISQLDDVTLTDALIHTGQVQSALIRESAKRGLFSDEGTRRVMAERERRRLRGAA